MVKVSKKERAATDWLRDIVKRNRTGKAVGVFSVCSAHSAVLAAAMRQAARQGSSLLVESTSNQVNQYGGYTGMQPDEFRAYLYGIALRVGFGVESVLLGGDHLGPYPWRNEKSTVAMTKANELVRECVLAGYRKIHLDASMACSDDPGRLSDEVIAERAAQMCKVAEQASAERGASEIVYVIGTEVPVPGGELLENHAPAVTRVEDMQKTIAVARAAFLKQGLENAWDRVIGLVVQPGVEFGDTNVFDYARKKANALAKGLPDSPELVYEAHSTDYQKAVGLKELVEDHFAILKVGPWLTFAFREAVFALSVIEREWLGKRAGVRVSRVREALEEAMVQNPEYWKSYYAGSEEEQKFARIYSYSDRCRYYWPDRKVQEELNLLMRNLSAEEIPMTLISQYLAEQYEAVREGLIKARPEELIDDRIGSVLRKYAAACGHVESGSS